MKLALRVELLGHFRLSFESQAVLGLSTREQNLLAYLILHRQNPQPRQQMAFLFWPDSSEEQALTNLRRELHQLRHHLPQAEDFLLVDHKQLGWRLEAPAYLDVTVFEESIRLGSRKTLAEALELYRGDLLISCYDDWILPERERLHHLGVEAHQRLIELLEEDREYRAAIEQTRHLLDLEPLHEGAYRTLMRLHTLQGERAAALHAYHTCVSVLERELMAKPSGETQTLYQRVLDASPFTLSSRPTPMPMAGVYSLVGRQEEWGALQQAWEEAAAGKASFVVIQGEAGIGKTRLAEELLGWCSKQGITTARTRCYAAEGRLAFAPVTEWLRTEDLQAGLDSVEPIWLSQVAWLLPELLSKHPDLPRPQPLSESWQRQQFFEALARCFLRDQQPLLLVLDDIQWCDSDTLEWLHYLLRFDGQARLLLVCTLRLEERQDNLAVQVFLRDLGQLGRLSELELGPLNEAETAELAAQVTKQPPEARLTTELFRQTEGHPLFVVELAYSGLTPFANPLPPKVQAVIATRLAQLSVEAKAVVELAAIIGRDFAHQVLREASDLDEKNLVQALDELWQRRVIREQGVLSYDFSHDRLRDVAYIEVNPAKRRLLHRRVAQALELIHGESLDAVSAQLAHHHEQAGQTAKAIRFYGQAAQVARQISAHEDAIRSLSKALALLQQLPATLQRDRQELSLQTTFFLSLMPARGYSAAEVEASLLDIGRLGQQLGEREGEIKSLLGLSGVYFIRGNIRKSLELGIESSRLAKTQPHWAPASAWTTAGALLGMGALLEAKTHFELGLAGYDPEHPNNVWGSDGRATTHAWESHALWLLGYPSQALSYYQRAVELAKGLENPFDLAFAYAYGAILHQMLQDHNGVLVCAQKVLELSAKYGLVYYRDWGLILTGWDDSDTRRIHQGLENLQTIRAEVRRPYYLGLLAETYLKRGQPEEADSTLNAALATAAQNEDVWWLPELHRLKGELTCSEAYFHTALEVARAQESKSLELRAAMSLARLWHKEGRYGEALELLEPIYNWFSEGLDTWDLQQAQMLIQTLSA